VQRQSFGAGFCDAEVFSSQNLNLVAKNSVFSDEYISRRRIEANRFGNVVDRVAGLVFKDEGISAVSRVRPINADVIGFGDAPYPGLGEYYEPFQYAFHMPFHGAPVRKLAVVFPS
jgi:hypothetical protein